MNRKTDINTENRRSNKESIVGTKEPVNTIDQRDDVSKETDQSGDYLVSILSDFVRMASRITILANNEIGRMEQLKEENQLSNEQEMYMERDFRWCFQEDKK